MICEEARRHVYVNHSERRIVPRVGEAMDAVVMEAVLVAAETGETYTLEIRGRPFVVTNKSWAGSALWHAAIH